MLRSAFYVEEALRSEAGSILTNTGALSVRSGAKTGRSPKDERVVREPGSENNVWWGPVNIPLEESAFMINRERAVDYLNTRKRLFVFDGFAGWDHEHRIAVRVVTERAYHALFMHTMLVRPTAEELANFVPDFTILNAGCFPANRCFPEPKPNPKESVARACMRSCTQAHPCMHACACM